MDLKLFYDKLEEWIKLLGESSDWGSAVRKSQIGKDHQQKMDDVWMEARVALPSELDWIMELLEERVVEEGTDEEAYLYLSNLIKKGREQRESSRIQS